MMRRAICTLFALMTAVGAVSSEEYDRVLAIVFAPATQAPKNLAFSIVVRFRPAFEPESQLIIRQSRGQVGNVEYIAAERNVYYTITELLRVTPGLRPDVLARRIHVQRRRFDIPATRAFAIQAGLFDSLNETTSALRAAGLKEHATGVVTVTLDGESYDLWYEQGLTKFSGDFSASEADLSATPNGVSIGKWARALRDEMAR
jgi:hypothetical protein